MIRAVMPGIIRPTDPNRFPSCGSLVDNTTGGCGWLMFAAGEVQLYVDNLVE